ncbi:MAG: hypothetical protein Q9181_000504 [Wetmoreana brouardii]
MGHELFCYWKGALNISTTDTRWRYSNSLQSSRLEKAPLTYHKEVACITMSRTTLIVFVILSGARESYRRDGPAGLRLAFGGYNGTYQIEWPLGQRPTLLFRALEKYQGGKDIFPTYFSRRPSKCIEMLLSIVNGGRDNSNKAVKVAFAGRKRPGQWLLRFLPKGFNTQRAAPDVYNLLGGRAHEVDLLCRECLNDDAVMCKDARKLQVPSLEDDKTTILYFGEREEMVIADCLDHLPWSPIPWSIHGGMKDVVVAYALPYLAAYQQPLARTLAEAVNIHSLALQHRGWNPEFIHESMAEKAASAILYAFSRPHHVFPGPS